MPGCVPGEEERGVVSLGIDLCINEIVFYSILW